MNWPTEDLVAAASVGSAVLMIGSSFFVPNEAHAEAIRITGGGIIMLTIVGWVAFTGWRHRRR